MRERSLSLSIFLFQTVHICDFVKAYDKFVLCLVCVFGIMNMHVCDLPAIIGMKFTKENFMSIICLSNSQFL